MRAELEGLLAAGLLWGAVYALELARRRREQRNHAASPAARPGLEGVDIISFSALEDAASPFVFCRRPFLPPGAALTGLVSLLGPGQAGCLPPVELSPRSLNEPFSASSDGGSSNSSESSSSSGGGSAAYDVRASLPLLALITNIIFAATAEAVLPQCSSGGQIDSPGGFESRGFERCRVRSNALAALGEEDDLGGAASDGDADTRLPTGCEGRYLPCSLRAVAASSDWADPGRSNGDCPAPATPVALLLTFRDCTPPASSQPSQGGVLSDYAAEDSGGCAHVVCSAGSEETLPIARFSLCVSAPATPDVTDIVAGGHEEGPSPPPSAGADCGRTEASGLSKHESKGATAVPLSAPVGRRMPQMRRSGGTSTALAHAASASVVLDRSGTSPPAPSSPPLGPDSKARQCAALVPGWGRARTCSSRGLRDSSSSLPSAGLACSQRTPPSASEASVKARRLARELAELQLQPSCPSYMRPTTASMARSGQRSSAAVASCS